MTFVLEIILSCTLCSLMLQILVVYTNIYGSYVNMMLFLHFHKIVYVKKFNNKKSIFCQIRGSKTTWTLQN